MTESWKSRMKPATVAVFVSDVNAEMPQPTVEEIFQPTDKLKLFTITQWLGGTPTITMMPIKGPMNSWYHRVIVVLDDLLANMNVFHCPDDLKDLGQQGQRTRHIYLYLSKSVKMEEYPRLADYTVLDTTNPNPLLYRENGNWMTNDYFDPSFPRGNHQYFVHLLVYPAPNWKISKFDIVQKTAEWTERKIHNAEAFERVLELLDMIQNPSGKTTG